MDRLIYSLGEKISRGINKNIPHTATAPHSAMSAGFAFFLLMNAYNAASIRPAHNARNERPDSLGWI